MESTQVKKKSKKKIILIIIGVLVVIGIASAAMSGSGGDSKSEDKSSGTMTTEEKQAAEKEAAAKEEEAKMTTAQKNAYNEAQDYLATMAFSRAGLLEQLTSEYGSGYEQADAEFAIQKLEKDGDVNWNEQAVKAAKEYLETQSFSKDGLIQQLESEYGSQFTHEQAVYGVERAYK